MARRRTGTEEDEIQLVNHEEGQEEEEEEEGEGGEDTDENPPCMKITFSDLDENEPRVQDEMHIRHPGRVKLKLRVSHFSVINFFSKWCAYQDFLFPFFFRKCVHLV